MSRHAKMAAGIFAYTAAGAVIGAVAAYLLGMLGGIVVTYYNNNYLADAPQGSYVWWANFFGYISAIFAIVPGACVGLAIKLYRLAAAAN